MKYGLVLEGGAMRGMFTAGVLDVFLTQGIELDGVVGVSAGATFGCNYKSRQTGRAIRYNKEYARDWRYCSVRSLILTGDLYGADFCYRELPMELDPFDADAFSKNPIPFYVVVTDMETGKPVYYRCSTGLDEDLLWIRGSASMPLVSKPVSAGGRLLLDGGITDSIPLHFMQGRGFERNIVILTQPEGYTKKQSRAGVLTAKTLGKYPAAKHALLRRPHNYNAQLRYVQKCEEEGSVLVIRPPEKLPINRICHDPDVLQETYEIGREEAERNLSRVRAFIDRETDS